VASTKPWVSSRVSVDKRTSRFPSTNSFISAKLNRSKFGMVMFIYPQHAPAGGPPGPRVFRLILYWKRLLLSGSSSIGNGPSFQAHPVLDCFQLPAGSVTVVTSFDDSTFCTPSDVMGFQAPVALS
jgi:hypothetical protein